MPPRKLSAMTAEDREAKVEALSPAWAKDYIRQLEGLTRALHAQLQAAQAQGAEDLHLAREISGARDRLAAAALSPPSGVAPGWSTPPNPLLSLPPGDAAIAWRALDLMDSASLGENDDAVISQVSAYFAQQLPPRPDGSEPHDHGPWLAGITPPTGEYATVRVLDGAANMEPLADLPERAEIRFADFYQVRYGNHETSGGARALIVETDQPLVIRPVGWGAVIISRAG